MNAPTHTQWIPLSDSQPKDGSKLTVQIARDGLNLGTCVLNRPGQWREIVEFWKPDHYMIYPPIPLPKTQRKKDDAAYDHWELSKRDTSPRGAFHAGCAHARSTDLP